jgi:hypothetical protein
MMMIGTLWIKLQQIGSKLLIIIQYGIIRIQEDGSPLVAIGF